MLENNKTMFGIFHTTYERNPEIFYKMIKTDYINTLIVECDYQSESFGITLDELLKTDKTAWVSVHSLGFKVLSASKMVDNDGTTTEEFNPEVIMLKDYKQRIDKFIAFLKENNYYGKVMGFYLDEPLLWNYSNDWLEEFTGYFRTVAAPDKRFFICFSVAGVAPDFWTINQIKPITHKSSQYLTDIAFDMYHKWSSDYENITKEMLQRAGNRDDLKVWFIPCTMDYRGDKTEEHCLEHLNECYKLLKKQKNPGGLMCFTYYTFKSEEEALGNIGLDLLTDPHYKKYWKNLEDRIIEIGQEICGSKKRRE